MDTKSQISISKGPSLLDLEHSLTRKRLFRNTPEMFLVQSVEFITPKGSIHILIDSLKRPELEWDDGQIWQFEGWIIQMENTPCMTWIPCNGEYSVTNRTGWIISPTNPISVFHLETSASFAMEDGQNEAIRQFREKNPDVIFLQYVTPNGYYFVRVLDAKLNTQFMEFLSAQFSGICTIYPKGFLR